MHNVFEISLVVRREALSFTLSVEGCTDLKNIVHFYRVRVTKFSTRGGFKRFSCRGTQMRTYLLARGSLLRAV